MGYKIPLNKHNLYKLFKMYSDYMESDWKEMKKFLSSLPLLLLKRQPLPSPLLPIPLSFLSLFLYLSLFLSSLQILLTLIPYPVPIYKLYTIPPKKAVNLKYLEINCIFLCNPWTKYKEWNYKYFEQSGNEYTEHQSLYRR